MKNNVVSIIVTFNRSALLKKAVNAVISQTHPCSKLILVDNNSTDETESVVRTITKHSAIDIEYYKCEMNTGGAGGFATGIELAKKYKPDYFWLMDDDGLPSFDCLENLLDGVNQIGVDVACPLITPEKSDELLSFVIYDYRNKKRVTKVNQVIEWCGGGSPFNGTLISSRVIAEIGTPNPKYFIYGDETEYFQRLYAAKFSVATFAAAQYNHPKGVSYLDSLNFKSRARISNVKYYCMVRNGFDVALRSRSISVIIVFFLKETLRMLSYFKWKALRIYFDALYHRIINKWDGHLSYL